MTTVIDLTQQDAKQTTTQQTVQLKLKPNRFYFIDNNGWYFHCRDGTRGPFESKSNAKQSLENHINQQHD